MARIRQAYSYAAAVGYYHNPVALCPALHAECLACGKELLVSVELYYARLFECGPVYLVPACNGPCMGARGSDACPCLAHLYRHDGLVGRAARGGLDKSPAVIDRLDVYGNRLCLRVVGKEIQTVRLVHVRLIAVAHDPGNAYAVSRKLIHRGHCKGAALRYYGEAAFARPLYPVLRDEEGVEL